MEKIRISDITMKQLAKQADHSLSFKGKLEISKLLDKLAVPVIEVEGIRVGGQKQHRGRAGGAQRGERAGDLGSAQGRKVPQTAGHGPGEHRADGVSVPQKAGRDARMH